MNQAHIPSFQNRIPRIDWQAYLQKFHDKGGDDVVVHLIRFHLHVCRLRIEFPEDCLMKMFMETLEEKTRLWYEGLPPASLYSLKDFYSVFCENYKEN